MMDLTQGEMFSSYTFILTYAVFYTALIYMANYLSIVIGLPYWGAWLSAFADISLGCVIPQLMIRRRVTSMVFLPRLHVFPFLFLAILLFVHILVFPLGIFGTNAVWKLFTWNAAVSALPVCSKLLIPSIAQAMCFWGVILHSLERKLDAWVSILLTATAHTLYSVICELNISKMPSAFVPLTFYNAFLTGTFTLFTDSLFPSLIFFYTIQCVFYLSLEDHGQDAELAMFGVSLLTIALTAGIAYVFGRVSLNPVATRAQTRVQPLNSSRSSQDPKRAAVLEAREEKQRQKELRHQEKKERREQKAKERQERRLNRSAGSPE